MSGYGRYHERGDAKERRARINETERLVNEGNMTTKEIAAVLGVSEYTVRQYRGELLAAGRIARGRTGPRKSA